MNNYKRYTLENKPNFMDGEMVEVELACFGFTPESLKEYVLPPILTGKIVGKALDHIIDHWLIEFGRHFPSYPYKVVSVPHTFILNEKHNKNILGINKDDAEVKLHEECMTAAYGWHGQG